MTRRLALASLALATLAACSQPETKAPEAEAPAVAAAPAGATDFVAGPAAQLKRSVAFLLEVVFGEV